MRGGHASCWRAGLIWGRAFGAEVWEGFREVTALCYVESWKTLVLEPLLSACLELKKKKKGMAN